MRPLCAHGVHTYVQAKQHISKTKTETVRQTQWIMSKRGCYSVWLLKLTALHNVKDLKAAQHLCGLLLKQWTKTSPSLSNTFQLRKFLFLFLLELQVSLFVVIKCSTEVFPLPAMLLFQVTVLFLQLLMLTLQDEYLSKGMFSKSHSLSLGCMLIYLLYPLSFKHD